MQLTFSLYSLAGLLIALGIGLIVFGLYQRLIYPLTRTRYEKAKMTGTHKHDPGLIRVIIKIIGYLILPALGFVFGDLVLSGLHS